MWKFLISFFLFIIICLLAFNAFLLYLNLQAKTSPSVLEPNPLESKSIGVQTAETVGQLNTKVGDSYQTLNQQAEKTSQEFNKTTGDALIVLNQQAAKLSADLNKAYQKMKTVIDREIQRFNETLKKKSLS